MEEKPMCPHTDCKWHTGCVEAMSHPDVSRFNEHAFEKCYRREVELGRVEMEVRDDGRCPNCGLLHCGKDDNSVGISSTVHSLIHSTKSIEEKSSKLSEDILDDYGL